MQRKYCQVREKEVKAEREKNKNQEREAEKKDDFLYLLLFGLIYILVIRNNINYMNLEQSKI